MNILYLCHRIPYPPNKGDKIRSFHQIKALAANHSVHLACMIDERDDLKHIDELKKFCASVEVVFRGKALGKALGLLGIFSRQSLSVVSFYSKALQRKITDILNSGSIDAIFVFSSAMAEYVRNIDSIPRIIDFVDVDSEKWRHYAELSPFYTSWIYRLEADRLVSYEEEIAKEFDHSIFISDKEVEILQSRIEGQPVSVISNGVDLDYFAPENLPYSRSTEPNLIFTGMMDYFPNIDAVMYFCDEVFPRIKSTIPEAQFYIVGRNPTAAVKKLGERENVVVTGGVDDIREFMAKARVAVAPLRIARGVQNKTLEAMAMGLPVVGTSKTFQGIKATSNDGIRMADTPEQFAVEVCRFFQQPELQAEASSKALEFVRKNHRWDEHGAQVEDILNKVTNKFQSIA